MREIHAHLAPYWLGGLIEAASVDGGPTDEQLRIVQGLLRGYFGIESAIDLVPLPAEELREIITDTSSRYRLVQTMVILQFARHPASEELADSVERYASILGVDEPMLVVARDAARHSKELLMADWARFARNSKGSPQLHNRSDDEFAAQFDALRQCPDGSLGRAFIDFYQSNGFALPATATGLSLSLVNHDFTHVLTGYRPNDAVEEVAISAMLVSSANGEEHFSALAASMALYEVGLFDILGITPTKGVLDRHGAPEVFAEAMRRGASCSADLAAIDHLALADQPIRDIRGSFSIPTRLI
jgi:ubiquinone biosynthesis protein Coq4